MVNSLYNLYDGEELILEKAQPREIIALIGAEKLNVANYADLQHLYKGRYRMENAEDVLITEWNKAVEPFKRVIWVKSGGRKLTLGGSKK